MTPPMTMNMLEDIIAREGQAARSALCKEVLQIHLDLAHPFREKATEQQMLVRISGRPGA